MKKSKFFTVLGVLLLSFGAVITNVAIPRASAASCPAKPYMTLTPNFDVAGEYTVWAQESRAADSTASVYISTNNGSSCERFASPSNANSWTWVQGANGKLKMSFVAGQNTIRAYVDGGTVLLANLLFTLDGSCVPTNDGTNCVQKPLQLSVSGLRQGDVVSGDITVETTVSTATTESVRMEYYFDNTAQPYSTSTKAPYCLVLTNNACASWPSSSLSNGQHTLKIRGVAGSGPTEQIITFSINNSAPAAPSPSPSPTPSPTPVPTPKPSPSPTPTPSPKPSPSPSPTPSPTPVPVTSSSSKSAILTQSRPTTQSSEVSSVK